MQVLHALRKLRVTAIFDLLKRHLVLVAFLAIVVWGYQWRHDLFGGFLESTTPTGTQGGNAAATGAWRASVAPHPSRFRPATPTVEQVSAPGLDHDLLQTARRAYWIGDYAGADAAYRRYLEQHPADPDGYGELGNLLFAQDKRNEAREMFRQAAGRLENQGRHDEAAALRKRVDGGDG